MFRNLKLVAILIFINSCGFSSVYNQNNQESYQKNLATIVIKKDRNRLNQILKNHLYDLFNPENLVIEKKYLLTLKISQSISSTYITETGSSGRNKITINVNFNLINQTTKQLISSGFVSVNDNYDVSRNRFATNKMEDYLKENLLKTAAAEIRNDIIKDL